MAKVELKTAPLHLLRTIALAIAGEIDSGNLENADLLEEVFKFIQNAMAT